MTSAALLQHRVLQALQRPKNEERAAAWTVVFVKMYSTVLE